MTSTSTVASGRVDADPAREADIAVPVDWGRYRLEVATDDPAGPATSVEFDAGWFVEATSTETPDGLEIALDKESYAAGETARLKVSPRFAGELLIAVGSETLRAVHTASIPAEGGDDRHSRRRRLGRRRLCHRHALPSRRRRRDPHARPRHRRQMAEGRSGRAKARR